MGKPKPVTLDIGPNVDAMLAEVQKQAALRLASALASKSLVREGAAAKMLGCSPETFRTLGIKRIALPGQVHGWRYRVSEIEEFIERLANPKS